jgi:protocatechuate 3,4-dioxygenase beta subunit
MRNNIVIAAVAVAVGLLACEARADRKEILVGGPCNICDAVFEGWPAKLASSTRIAPATEPGEPLAIDGVVRDAAGKPVAGVVVYAYHTNAKGEYPPGQTPNGTLRGWTITSKDGAYHFDTIRPASYPNTKIPQHVHLHVVEPGKCHYTVDSVVFTDDPYLTREERERESNGRGGSGIVTPTNDKGTWRVRRDVTLGAGIHDYARCTR